MKNDARDLNNMTKAEGELIELMFEAYRNIYIASLFLECMLYDFDNRLDSIKRKIRDLDEKENAEIIMMFLDQLFAEGLSKPRVLKYATHLKIISEKMGMPFTEAEKKDITRYLSDLEQSTYSAQTKRDYRVVLRRLFSYLGRNELVRDVKTTLRGSKKKLPEELLNPAEVRKLIEAAKHPRDKAMIGILYEGGLRIGELAGLKVKNIQFDEYGVVIKVRGKTGERRVRIVMFASLLAKWMEMHPEGDDKDSPLWVNLSNNCKKKGITYEGISQKVRRIAKKAGIKKRVNFHNFRHSRATHMASLLTEAQMNEYFGWIQGSDMPATYVHLSGRDVDDKILQIHGLKPKDAEKQDELRPKECPRCSYINASISRYCGRCGTVLDEEERIKLEMKSRDVSKEFPDLSIADPELLEEMKKFRDMLEFFEEHPDLFKKMKTMVEG